MMFCCHCLRMSWIIVALDFSAPSISLTALLQSITLEYKMIKDEFQLIPVIDSSSITSGHMQVVSNESVDYIILAMTPE